MAFPFKEDFAKLCFETLLQFSFFKDTHSKGIYRLLYYFQKAWLFKGLGLKMNSYFSVF